MVAQKEAAVFGALRKSLASNGALIDGVAICEHEDDVRSLIATRTLAPGHVILRVPPSQIISEKRARECPTVAAIMDAVKDAALSERLPDVDGADAAITLFVLHEMARGESSPLAPWLATLPSSFETPMTEDEDEIHSHLSGSPVLYLTLRLREELREMFDEWLIPYALDAYPEAFPHEFCTFERFMYVHSVYDSRAFHVDDSTMLVPFADMANHDIVGSTGVNIRVRGWKVVDNNSTAEAEEDADLGVELYVCSPEEIRPGTELKISYGAFANGQLLMHYGFALENNPADTLPITLSVPDNDSVHVQTKKLILLNLDNTGLLSFNHDLSAEKPMPLGLLATTRLLVMEEEELAPVTIRNANFGEQISDTNELAAREQLRQIFLNMLDDYPTDAELQSSRKGGNRLHAYCAIYVKSMTGIIGKAIEALRNLPRTARGTEEAGLVR